MEKLIHSSTDCIDRKQNHGANLLFHKIPVSLHLGITPNTEFQRHLTPYACSYVQKQFELSKHVVIPENSANTVSVQRQGGETQSPYSDREGKCRRLSQPAPMAFKSCLCHVGTRLHQGVSLKWRSMTKTFVLHDGPEHQ